MTERATPTICVRCKHHGRTSCSPTHQFAYECRHPATEQPAKLNLATGKMDHSWTWPNNRFPHCCDVNDGNCERFVRRKSWIRRLFTW